MGVNYIHLRKNLSFTILILLVFTLPLNYTINSTLASTLTFFWILEGNFFSKLKEIRKNVVFIFSIIFYLLHIVGLSYTSNLKEGLFITEKLLPFLVFPLVLGTGKLCRVIKEKQIIIFYTLIISYLLSTLFCLIFATYRSISTSNFKSYNVDKWVDEYHFLNTGLSAPLKIHPVYFSLHISIVILILIFCFYNFSKKYKVLVVLLIVYFNIFLILLSARTVLVSYFLLVLIYCSYSLIFKRNKYLSFSFLIILISVILIILKIPGIKDRYKEVLVFEYDISNPSWQGWSGTSIRLAEWKCAFDVIKKFPLLGVGTGDGEEALLESYKENNFIRGLDNKWNCHNQFLETSIKLGFLGLFSLLALYSVSVINGLNNRNLLQVSLIAMFILAGTTESLLATQKGIVFFSVLSTIFSIPNQKNITTRED